MLGSPAGVAEEGHLLGAQCFFVEAEVVCKSIDGRVGTPTEYDCLPSGAVVTASRACLGRVRNVGHP